MLCECGARLECYGGEIYCPDCLSFGIVPDADADGPAEQDDADLVGVADGDDMDGDHATALRDAGWGTDEDYGCFFEGE